MVIHVLIPSEPLLGRKRAEKWHAERVPADGFDANVIRSAYAAVVDEYAATFGEDLAQLELDRRVLDAVAARCAARGVVLDLGCGPAHIARYLVERGAGSVGIDFTPAMLGAARPRDRTLPLAAGDVRALPVRDRSVAGIVAFYVLQHVPRAQLGGVLREMRRVLIGEGLFAAAFHAGDGELQVGAVTATRYRAEELGAYLEAASFVVETIEHREPLPHEHPGPRSYLTARAI
jgi:ubiquinone/menaquinone biosynthesis C-methylase UbiE